MGYFWKCLVLAFFVAVMPQGTAIAQSGTEMCLVPSKGYYIGEQCSNPPVAGSIPMTQDEAQWWLTMADCFWKASELNGRNFSLRDAGCVLRYDTFDLGCPKGPLVGPNIGLFEFNAQNCLTLCATLHPRRNRPKGTPVS